MTILLILSMLIGYFILGPLLIRATRPWRLNRMRKSVGLSPKPIGKPINVMRSAWKS